MMTSRVRLLVASGLLGGALTLSSVGSAFAAPLSDNPTPIATLTATTTTTATTPTRAAHRGARIALVLRGFFQPIAQLFGITGPDLLKQLAQGQTLAQLA